MFPSRVCLITLQQTRVMAGVRRDELAVVSSQKVGGDLQVHLPIGKAIVLIGDPPTQNLVAITQVFDLICGYGPDLSSIQWLQRRGVWVRLDYPWTTCNEPRNRHGGPWSLFSLDWQCSRRYTHFGRLMSNCRMNRQGQLPWATDDHYIL